MFYMRNVHLHVYMRELASWRKRICQRWRGSRNVTSKDAGRSWFRCVRYRDGAIRSAFTDLQTKDHHYWLQPEGILQDLKYLSHEARTPTYPFVNGFPSHHWLTFSVQHVSGKRIFWRRNETKKQVSKLDISYWTHDCKSVKYSFFSVRNFAFNCSCIRTRAFAAHQEWLTSDFVQKLVRLRCAQERELRCSGRHWELRTAGGFTVSTGAAKLCATSDVSSQKCWILGGGRQILCFCQFFLLFFFCLFILLYEAILLLLSYNRQSGDTMNGFICFFGCF